MITILILLINPGGLHCYLLMFTTTLQGRCHQLNFREEETKALTGYSFTNGIQQGQGIAGFEFVCLTPKSVSSQGHAVNTFRWSWGTVYRGQHKMKSRPPVFQDRNYSSLTPGKTPSPPNRRLLLRLLDEHTEASQHVTSEITVFASH